MTVRSWLEAADALSALLDGLGHRIMAGRYRLKGIALSGYGMEEDVRQSRQAGFERHLTKPVTVPELEEAIAHTPVS